MLCSTIVFRQLMVSLVHYEALFSRLHFLCSYWPAQVVHKDKEVSLVLNESVVQLLQLVVVLEVDLDLRGRELLRSFNREGS